MIKIKVVTEQDSNFSNPDIDNQLWLPESEKIIDHDNPSDRKWLGSHCFWAMRNGRKVTIYTI